MRHLLGLVVLLALVTPARADFGMSDATLTDLSFNATNQLLMRNVVANANKRVASRSSRSTIAPVVGKGSSTIRALAASAPAGDRAKLEAQLTELLATYGKIEKQLSIPRDDLAGAMAAAIAASYMAYRSAEVSDASFAALLAQLRPSVAANPELSRATAASRRELYERLAITSAFLGTTYLGNKSQPPAWLAKAGAQLLSQLVGVDAARVVIDDKGLTIRAQ